MIQLNFLGWFKWVVHYIVSIYTHSYVRYICDSIWSAIMAIRMCICSCQVLSTAWRNCFKIKHRRMSERVENEPTGPELDLSIVEKSMAWRLCFGLFVYYRKCLVVENVIVLLLLDFFYQNAIICYWCVGLSGPMNVKRTNQQKNNTKWQIMKETKKQIWS